MAVRGHSPEWTRGLHRASGQAACAAVTASGSGIMSFPTVDIILVLRVWLIDACEDPIWPELEVMSPKSGKEDIGMSISG